MKIGRNFQDCLLSEYLSAEEKAGVAGRRVSPGDAARAHRKKVHTDVARQARVAADMGLQHVELEQNEHGLFSIYEPDALFAMRETAKIYGITLSVHLSGPAAEIFLHPVAADVLKKEIDAFKVLGCGTMVVMAPAHFFDGVDPTVWKMRLEPLQASAQYAADRGLNCFLEIPLRPDGLIERLAPLREASSALGAAVRLSTHSAVKGFMDKDSDGLPFLYRYIRVSPMAEVSPGGLLTHQAGKEWPASSLEGLVKSCLARGTELLVFSGNITDAGDLGGYRDVLSKESEALRAALEKVASPFSHRRRP